MLDMQQSNPAMISNAVMANKMKELKEGKAFSNMCKELQALITEEKENAMVEVAATYLEFLTNTEDAAQKLMKKYGIDKAKAMSVVEKAKAKI